MDGTLGERQKFVRGEENKKKTIYHDSVRESFRGG